MADDRPKAEEAPDIPLLRIDAVVKKFGALRAVDRLSLDIAAGEFFALLGPSGCGKTTLLRMLAGFETPDEGRILLNGRDIAPVLPHERPVNMMFQSYALFPHLSVRDNIAFGLKRAGMAKADINTRLAESTRDAGTVYVAEPRNALTKSVVSVAIRPEKVKLSRRAPAAEGTSARAFNCLEGVITDVSYLGGVTTYKVKLDSGAIVRS